MDNNDFKIKIIDFYRDVDKPIITSLYDDMDTKNVLELSTVTNFNVLKKNKNNWKIKDKRTLLKEIDIVKKKKIKEFSNMVSKYELIGNTLLKETNNKILSELDTIDNLKKVLEKDEIYEKIKNLTQMNSVKVMKTKHKSINNKYNKTDLTNLTQTRTHLPQTKIDLTQSRTDLSQIKIVDLKQQLLHTPDSENYIEIFSN
jgi:hypothetical protein